MLVLVCLLLVPKLRWFGVLGAFCRFISQAIWLAVLSPSSFKFHGAMIR